MSGTRQTWAATVEAGAVPEFARLDTGNARMWLYPIDDDTVRVEVEEKPAAETAAAPERAGRVGESQPLPIPNSHPGVHAAVIADLEARCALGTRRYGVALQPHNGRRALLDFYEELLDGVCYLKQHLMETEMPEPGDANLGATGR